jgi:hypothetical protein
MESMSVIDDVNAPAADLRGTLTLIEPNGQVLTDLATVVDANKLIINKLIATSNKLRVNFCILIS